MQWKNHTRHHSSYQSNWSIEMENQTKKEAIYNCWDQYKMLKKA
ncbi:unnamed protein product [Musa textilis]